MTIPLSGQLEHKDNHGHHGVIGAGDVQVMSAGTGITHSEFNASETESRRSRTSVTEAVSVLQMWVETDALDHDPRYEDRKFPKADKNTFQLLVSPDERDGSLMIHQQAFFNLGEFDPNLVTSYVLRDAKHGAYIFVIEGEIEVDGNKLGRRDAIGIGESKEIELKIKSATADAGRAKVLLIEVPMK